MDTIAARAVADGAVRKFTQTGTTPSLTQIPIDGTRSNDEVTTANRRDAAKTWPGTIVPLRRRVTQQ